MYLKSTVKIPDVHGKLTRLKRGGITYIKYEYDRYYDPEKKYTYPQRATIGKVCVDDDTMMIPNEAFLKYFPDAVLACRNKRERIYISYDSTNKNCRAGDIELAEFGHAKTDIGSAIINYSVGYDLKNKEPLFYEAYPGSINDVSQLRMMLGKITGYGYKKIGFILDRGYFSRENIRYLDECGYFVIITSEKMTAKEALRLYKSRDASEKLLAADKTFLGNKSMRAHTNEGIEGRIFTQFIALIIRNKIYSALQEAGESYEKKQNYMTVPAAIKKLEKIEMTRQTDNIYRLDHAVTARQKKILKAFGMNEGSITFRAGVISNILKKSKLASRKRISMAREINSDLLDKRDALRQKKMLEAIAQSKRSYEEIMQHLQSDSEEV